MPSTATTEGMRRRISSVGETAEGGKAITDGSAPEHEESWQIVQVQRDHQQLYLGHALLSQDERLVDH